MSSHNNGKPFWGSSPLPAINILKECADALIAEPTANTAKAPSKMSRLPKVSANRPLIGRTDVHVTVYAAETHANESAPGKSRTIVGRAVPIEAC